MSQPLVEFRCKQCNRLLAKGDFNNEPGVASFKCRRCGAKNTFVSDGKSIEVIATDSTR